MWGKQPRLELQCLQFWNWKPLSLISTITTFWHSSICTCQSFPIWTLLLAPWCMGQGMEKCNLDLCSWGSSSRSSCPFTSSWCPCRVLLTLLLAGALVTSTLSFISWCYLDHSAGLNPPTFSQDLSLCSNSTLWSYMNYSCVSHTSHWWPYYETMHGPLPTRWYRGRWEAWKDHWVTSYLFPGYPDHM